MAVVPITWTKSRAVRGNHAWGPSYDTEGERGVRESCRDVIFWCNLHRDLFSSWKTTKQAVRRSVKQSGPTVNQDHSHAWQLFSVLLCCPHNTPPPPCLSTRLSSSSLSAGHNYSMKTNNFPKQHHQTIIPWSELKAWTWQQAQKILGEQNYWILDIVF